MAFFEEQQLLDKLSDLQELPTVEWVSATLYEIGVSELLEAKGVRDQVGTAFRQLLEAELEYHHELDGLLKRDEFSPRLLAEINRRRTAQLRRDLRRLATAKPRQLGLRGVREVGLAQCYWALGRPNKTVEHLGAALTDGVTSPLLWLVLGYARYEQAIEHYVRSGGRSPAAWARFQQACRDAVKCFEAGLGGEVDAQLYWWMGAVLAAAGFEEEAQEAFDKAHAAEEGWMREHADEYSLESERSHPNLLDDLPQITVFDEDLLFEDPYESSDLDWPDIEDDDLNQ